MAKVQNSTILDTIWATGTTDYQQRVPKVSQAGMDAALAALQDPTNGNIWGEFHEALVNRVGNVKINGMDWHNPLAIFKQDDLLRNGTTIEEIQLGMIEAEGYSPKDNNMFKVNPLKLYSAFHTMNRSDRYSISISRPELLKAFTSPTGIDDLIDRKLARPGLSDEYDEYRIMLQLFRQGFDRKMLHKVKVDFSDINNLSDTELKNLSRTIRATAKKMAVVPNGRYNQRKVATVSDPSNLVLITTPDVVAAMDVSVLADAFNIDRADFASRKIEVDQLPIPGALAILIDKSWLVCGDYLREANGFYNPKNMIYTGYLHRWGTYSISPFSNAAVIGAFEPDPEDVTDVTLNSISVSFVDEDGEATDGYDYLEDVFVEVDASGTVTPETEDIDVPDAATFEVTLVDGEGKPVNKTSRTRVNKDGKLLLQKGLARGTEVTVTATSTYVDPSDSTQGPERKTATATLVVL